jgi:hypothetical protein
MVVFCAAYCELMNMFAGKQCRRRTQLSRNISREQLSATAEEKEEEEEEVKRKDK